MRKSKITTINVCLLLLFYLEQLLFCQKTYLENLISYCYICITVFLHGRLLVMQQQNTTTHIEMQWSCKRCTSTQTLYNRLGILLQILITMDYHILCILLFKYSYFREVLSIQRKTKSFVEGYFWLTPCKQPDLLTAKLFFRLIISQTYVHKLERYCLYWC